MTIQQLMKSIEEYNLNIADPFGFKRMSITICIDDYDINTFNSYYAILSFFKKEYTKEFNDVLFKTDFNITPTSTCLRNILKAFFKVGDYFYTYKVSIFIGED